MTYEKEIQIGENDVSLQILDTAGNVSLLFNKPGAIYYSNELLLILHFRS